MIIQTGAEWDCEARVFVSDFFDFSIYIDAREDDLETWYLERFQRLRENIEPTRERARLILEKGKDHRVERVWLRKL